MKKSRVVAAASLPLLVTFAAVVIALTTLPGRLDEFILTNDDYCHASSSEDGADHARRPLVRVDDGECEHAETIPGDSDRRDRARRSPRRKRRQRPPEAGRTRGGLLERATHPILWRLSLYIWGRWTMDVDDSATAATRTVRDDDEPRILRNRGAKDFRRDDSQNEGGGAPADDFVHPMCRAYRKFRSRLRFQRLLLPWNWHYRNELLVRGLTIHSSAEGVAFASNGEENAESSWRRIGRVYYVDAARIGAVPRDEKDERGPADEHARARPASHPPPSLEFEEVDLSFESGVVSARLRGITINIVVSGAGFSLGAMSMREALRLLPKPPEVHGLYPRIGVLNISKVSLAVYENKANNNNRSPLNLLLKMRIPDELFAPITNLTLAHKQTGIDQKDFQKMMETALSDSLHRHLLHEVAAAFRNSLARAQKAQEQLNDFIAKAQESYLDRWFGMWGQAWHQTQANVWKGVVDGTAPLVRAVEDFVCDLKEIVSEPVPPLLVVVSRYWNKTMDEISHSFTMEEITKYGIVSIDKQIWSHMNELVANFFGVKRKRIFGDLRDAFDRFVTKSEQDLKLLLESSDMIN